MADKKSTPPPIDRPLSKAYLREFKGWSTAYPPGLSDPTSLRISENIMITREGGARVRPALRSVLKQNVWLDQTYGARMVGGWDRFFLNDGSKALLFAARQADQTVGFRVAVYDDALKRYDILNLTDPRVGFEIPQGESVLNFTSATTFVKYLQIDNKIFALSDGGEDVRMFNVGSTKTARMITELSVPKWPGDEGAALPTGHQPSVVHPDAAWINNASKVTIPAAETPTDPASPAVGTLISSDATDNTFNYGFFYTFENEVGETKASPVTRLRARRGWSQWQFFAPDASGNKSTTAVVDPTLAMDQFVIIVPEAVFNSALAQKATKLNAYMFVWSDQDSVPMEATMIGSKPLTATSTRAKDGWIQATAAVPSDAITAIIPTFENRVNYSTPPGAAQGLVAGDRLILVNDRKNGAVIRWSSNLTGDYTNFSPSKGGGQKTLTSGNLLIPVAVKLWQNPQSVDTITILCSGIDGYSTSYYMAPASVDNQSTSTQIMAFEETTATPGTVSPYGVEVLNNALYHPLDTELMKSTANNYNINHKSMTDDVANKWVELRHKDNIISSQHDNRLYYLVHNPDGAELETGCKGNEIWVYDGAQDQGSWNRWLVQGISLSRLDIDGKLYLALARPEGIFVFDEFKLTDDKSKSGGTDQVGIPWRLETNTQGANRAHDAWAFVQQVNVTVGNFRGSMRYGVRFHDIHGRHLEESKTVHHPVDAAFSDTTGAQSRALPFDLNDHFQPNTMQAKEWYFFAESITENGVVTPSYGQLNYVQYTFTPLSVNTGYQYGSTETFEYGRDVARATSSTTYNGIPQPFADTQRP